MNDAANYLLFNNPVSSTLLSGLSGIARATGIKTTQPSSKLIGKSINNSTITMATAPLWRLAGSNLLYFRLGGLSGASAVILGAIGAHKPFPDNQIGDAKDKKDLKRIFETANRFHFFHSIALMATPIAHYPTITASLLLIGMTLFCGPCYYQSLTGDSKFNKFAPMGGICLILAWLSMVL